MTRIDNRETYQYLDSANVRPLDYARLEPDRNRRTQAWHYWVVAAHFIFFFMLGTIKVLWFSELRHWSPLVAQTAWLPWWNRACFYWHDNDASIYSAILIDAITLVAVMVRKRSREGGHRRLIVFSYATAQVIIAAVGMLSYRGLAWGSSIMYTNPAGIVVSEVMYTWDYVNPMMMAGAIAGPAAVIVAVEWAGTIRNRRRLPVV